MAAGRRGNGEGSIYYSEKLNRWVGQFTAGVKTNGMPNRKSVYGKTRKEVAEKITKALNEIKEHTYVETNDTPLIDIIWNTINDKHNANITSATTYKRDCMTYNIIKEASFSHKPICKITENDLKEFLLSTKKYANSSIDKIYRFLNNAFEQAINKRYIYSNPLKNIIKPKSDVPTKKVEALTIQQEVKLAEILNTVERTHPYRDIIVLMLLTGMRVGEILSLDVRRDIDLKNSEININVTLTRDINDKVILGKQGKTENATRTVKMIPKVKSIIESILENWKSNKHSLLFWDYADDTFVTPSEINCYLKRIAKKYNIIDHIHTHMLRHTYATRCIESGMSAVVLSKKLGHKDISVTLNTYTSVFAKYEDTQDDRYISYLELNSIDF